MKDLKLVLQIPERITAKISKHLKQKYNIASNNVSSNSCALTLNLRLLEKTHKSLSKYILMHFLIILTLSILCMFLRYMLTWTIYQIVHFKQH